MAGEQAVGVVEAEEERGRVMDECTGGGQAAEGGVLREGPGEGGDGVQCRSIGVKEIGSGLDSAGVGVEKGRVEVDGVSAWVVVVVL